MLTGFQDALVALATDLSLRRMFERQGIDALPLPTLEALSPRERAALRDLPFASLDRYARSLVAKRWDDVAKVVPLTRRISPRLEARYRTWAATHAMRATDTLLAPGAAEALRALPALHAALAADEGEAPYAADLLAFEVLGACARGDGAARSLRSGFQLVAIASDLRRGLIPIDPPRSRYELRFVGSTVHYRQA